MAYALYAAAGNGNVREYSGISYTEPEKFLQAIATTNVRYPFIVFSDRVREPYLGYSRFYAKETAALIQQHNLGTIVASKQTPNWYSCYNGDHNIQAWLWAPDWDALKAYCRRGSNKSGKEKQ
jgi:hypothetical protein